MRLPDWGEKALLSLRPVKPVGRSARAVGRVSPVTETLERRVFLSAATATHHVPAAHPTYRIFHHAGVAHPLNTTAPTGFTPQQIRRFYGIDQIELGGVAGDGSGQSIAIVDAFDLPTAFGDLQKF